MSYWVEIIVAVIGFASTMGTSVFFIVRAHQKNTTKLLDGLIGREAIILEVVKDNTRACEKSSNSSEKVIEAVDRLNGSINTVRTCPFDDQIVQLMKENLRS